MILKKGSLNTIFFPKTKISQILTSPKTNSYQSPTLGSLKPHSVENWATDNERLLRSQQPEKSAAAGYFIASNLKDLVLKKTVVYKNPPTCYLQVL